MVMKLTFLTTGHHDPSLYLLIIGSRTLDVDEKTKKELTVSYIWWELKKPYIKSLVQFEIRMNRKIKDQFE
ncbi:hypothetical protein LIER_19222 [Lithospermum erythrorhizon]|uniref:Uncharacterized protein n=1 Tax=Lithospermum erythrorhizon TaxID=34254 RepID=A0AAV3QK01_LITER